jgi:hypothetical protein
MYPKIFLSFMEPESSLPCSQELTTGSCSETDQYIPRSHTLFLQSILILPSNLSLGLESGLPFRISDKNSASISHFSCACCMPRSSLTVIIFDEGCKL